ncbi:MAG TPA: hypothetical protein VFB22_16870 [Candidatus Baltobacteraceae bacterium]|nr:hypothetical protein [Candidatus Baltobacteraceae bacterium]
MTRGRFVVLGTMCALAAMLLRPLPAPAAKVCVSAIPVDMVDKVDSKTARAGGTFRFKTTLDAQLDDGTPVLAGTPGYGLIRFADPAGRNGHDGSLALEPRYLVVAKPKGGYKRVDVTMNPTLPAEWTAKDLMSAVADAPIPVPGVSIAINAVRWGRNITLGPGFTFSVIPIDNLQHGPIC